MKRNALISVYEKSSLKKICKTLNKFDIGIISTGATAKKIISLGYECIEISNLTKFKEILDGRVKTLNSKLHASILYKRNNPQHKKTFKKLNFPSIDFVIVNFYPFTKISNKHKYEKKIEMIDIGGPSMIRSASKNFYFVTTVCENKYYDALINELNNNNGITTLAFRKKMAKYNFKLTSDYDLSIFNWFNKRKKIKENVINIKYGENPNQKAFFIQKSKFNIFNSKISGKDLNGVNKNFRIKYDMSKFFERDIDFFQKLFGKNFLKYNYKKLNVGRFYYHIFPLRCELITWKNTLKNYKIKHILSIPYFYFKRLIFFNLSFKQKIKLPNSIGLKKTLY